MAAVEQNQPSTIQDANKATSDAPKLFDKALLPTAAVQILL